MLKFNLKYSLDSIRQILAYMSNNPLLFGAFIVLSVVAAITEGISVSLLVPILEVQGNTDQAFAEVPILRNVVEMFGGMSNADKLKVAAVSLGGVIILRSFLLFLSTAMSIILPIRIQESLSIRGYKALMRVNIGYIHNSYVGTLTNAITLSPQRISMVLKGTADAFSQVLILGAYSVLMFSMSVEMTLIALAVMVILSMLMRYFLVLRLQRLGDINSAANAKLNQTTYETMNSMEQIRLSVAETFFVSRFTTAYKDLRHIVLKSQILAAIPGPALAAGVGLFICALMYWGGAYYKSEAGLWMSQLLLFIFLMMRLIAPVTAINNARTRILSHIAAMHETEAFLEEVENAVQPNGQSKFDELRSGIEFKDVSFSYDEDDRQVLSGISTTIHKGEMVAIVGASGAGKSTIVSMLTRLYDPQYGSIRIDGVDLPELEIGSWRKRVGVVSQDIVIFNDTVINNIGFWSKDHSEAEIRQAAKLATADDFIQRLSEGYETVLGDRGVRLSGGQKQRIAIARAILTDPDLLILDEGTSHLDSATERAIQQAVDELSKNRTVVIVAHRLSTIRKADRIIVMDHGKIVEEGTHVELSKAQGVYWNLLEHQKLDLIDDDLSNAKVLEAQREDGESFV